MQRVSAATACFGRISGAGGTELEREIEVAEREAEAAIESLRLKAVLTSRIL
jgi:hypothetical protein